MCSVGNLGVYVLCCVVCVVFFDREYFVAEERTERRTFVLVFRGIFGGSDISSVLRLTSRAHSLIPSSCVGAIFSKICSGLRTLSNVVSRGSVN